MEGFDGAGAHLPERGHRQGVGGVHRRRVGDPASDAMHSGGHRCSEVPRTSAVGNRTGASEARRYLLGTPFRREALLTLKAGSSSFLSASTVREQSKRPGNRHRSRKPMSFATPLISAKLTALQERRLRALATRAAMLSARRAKATALSETREVAEPKVPGSTTMHWLTSPTMQPFASCYSHAPTSARKVASSRLAPRACQPATSAGPPPSSTCIRK